MVQRNILCIEDNKENMQLFRRVLQSQNYNLFEAESGAKGLAIAEKEDIDLVLLDVNLPDIDGYEIARRLRNNPKSELAQVPIMIVTANAMKGDLTRAFDAGCNCYLSKPFDIYLLWDRIETLLHQPVNLD